MNRPQIKKITSPSFFTGNEVIDVFLPIMGAESFTVYSYFKRIEFTNPTLTHSIRGIAEATGIGDSTVSRSLEILEHLGLIKLTRFRGSRGSECKLLESRAVAIGMGAQYHRRTVSFSLPPQVAHRLRAEIKTLREKQQGKTSPKALAGASHACGNRAFGVSQRNASVSPEKRQPTARETQTGTHLIQEERKIEEGPTPTPTPSDSGEAQEDKDSPDEDEPDGLLKWAVEQFTGPMNDLRACLFDTNRPTAPHLSNGAEDWNKFGLGSLAVDAAAWDGETLVLTLGADDPAAAQLGLRKYHKRWDAALSKWYGCNVLCEIQRTTRTWWKTLPNATES